MILVPRKLLLLHVCDCKTENKNRWLIRTPSTLEIMKKQGLNNLFYFLKEHWDKHKTKQTKK